MKAINFIILILLLVFCVDYCNDIAAADNNPSNEKIINEMNNVIDSLIELDEFSGSILIAKNGVAIYKRAEGEACKRYHIKNNLNTKYCLGSMNKMFTGVAIAQLAQNGKLNFNDVIGKYLPDYPNKIVRDNITIHHLLTHTSGLGLYWRELLTTPGWAYLTTSQEYDNLTNNNELLGNPGEKFSYSNCGPIILGLIIEKISGLNYDDYIRKYVMEPAGMFDSDCYDIKKPIEGIAFGYTKKGFMGEKLDDWVVNWYVNPPKGSPAGGGYSTVEDLLKFDLALRNYILLNSEFTNLIIEGKVERNENTKYGYLFEDKIINEKRIVGHNGSAAGVNATLAMYWDQGYTVAILSNYDRGTVVIRKILENLITNL